ncbi:HdeD family acid-resistance protein [Saccharicrinis aurantiacus]|uniref:HdeD family acid-resistance protein n=1 Tax=Saccharicrinis aurantiacus TaxID=1849719 RepID=UPI00094FD5F6|nr:DUF308 domain-containing protein [Saccharicrinis aurantiacus]
MTNFLKVAKNSVKHWYLLTISGLIFIALGIWVFATPLESYLTLAFIFTLSFLVSGTSEIIFAISNRKEIDGWGWTLSMGLLNVLIGIILLIHPGISITTLPLFVGFSVMYRSIYAISMSIDLRNYGIMEWGNLLALGIIGLLFSFILIANPLFSGLSLVVITGSAFVIVGIYTIYYSIKLKQLNKLAKGIKGELINQFEDLKSQLRSELAGK